MLEKMKAAIFDMDGTLLDSMTEWRRLNGEFVRQRGITLTEKQEADMMSMSEMMVVDYFRDEFGIQSSFAELCAAAYDAMEKIYAAGVGRKPGAADYLRRLREKGVKCVLATPARQALVGLNKADMVSNLDYIFSTDMIGYDKSKTEFYDKLCSIIGVEKKDCVMFEDSLYAIRGAKNAGLLGVVGITDTTNTRDIEAIRACCDVVVDSYDEL